MKSERIGVWVKGMLMSRKRRASRKELRACRTSTSKRRTVAARVGRLRRLAVHLGPTPIEGEPLVLRDTVRQQFAKRARSLGLSDAEFREVMDRVLIHEVRPGRYVVTPTEMPSFVTSVGIGVVKTVIPAGVVEHRDERLKDELHEKSPRLIVQFAKPGYLVGFSSMHWRSASRRFGALAHSNSVVAEINRDVIVRVLQQIPRENWLTVVTHYCRALSRLIADKCRLLPLTIEDRLRCGLAQLARDFPRPGHPDLIDVVLHHRDLAELIGTNRTSIAKVMRKLKDVVRWNSDLQRYLVGPGILREVPPQTTEHVGSKGLPADEGDRENFRKAIPVAAREIGFPNDVAGILLQRAELRSFAPGDVIRVSDPPNATVLVSGTAMVMVRTDSGKDIGVWIAKPGQFIGSGWLSRAGAPLPLFYAVAHESASGGDCQVATLTRDVMLRIMERLSPGELLTFVGCCHEVLSRQVYDRTVMLPLSIPERLLYQLHVLAADFPEVVCDGTVINLPLDLGRDLAALIATNSAGVRRGLRDLEKAGRIRIEPDGRIVVVGFHPQRTKT